MRQTITTLVMIALALPVFSQNLMLEIFSGANITAYDSDIYSDNSVYHPIGFRIAGGLPNVQLGGEYHKDIKHASFDNAIQLLQTETVSEFDNSYYGGFIRANISPNPAYAFGIVLKAGVGIYDVTQTNKLTAAGIETTEKITYDGQLGFNGGIGFSLPIAEKLHLEAGYMYNLVKREGVEDYNANHHSFQVGFSYNFLFGESARRYDSNKRWKNGWRSSAGGRYKNWGKN